jgi:hypothetical protein
LQTQKKLVEKYAAPELRSIMEGTSIFSKDLSSVKKGEIGKEVDGSVLIDTKFIESSSALDVASVIVHELVHKSDNDDKDSIQEEKDALQTEANFFINGLKMD